MVEESKKEENKVVTENRQSSEIVLSQNRQILRAKRRIASTTAAEEEVKGEDSNEESKQAKSKFILKSTFSNATSENKENVKPVAEGPKPFKFTFGSTTVTTNLEEEKKSQESIFGKGFKLEAKSFANKNLFANPMIKPTI